MRHLTALQCDRRPNPREKIVIRSQPLRFSSIRRDLLSDHSGWVYVFHRIERENKAAAYNGSGVLPSIIYPTPPGSSKEVDVCWIDLLRPRRGRVSPTSFERT